MAKITVTSDEGEVMEVFTDSHNEIGNFEKFINRQHVISIIEDAVERCRKYRDNRDKDGKKI